MAKNTGYYFNCPICGKQTWLGRYEEYGINHYVELKDSKVCRECADELRVMYPVTFEENPYFHHKGYIEEDSDDVSVYRGESYHLEKSGMSEITRKEFKEKINEVEAYKAQLRRKYNGYGKVFEILSGSETKRLNPYEVGLPKMLKFKGTITYQGRAIVGNWERNDMVTLIHEGKEIRSKVLDASCDVIIDCRGKLKEGYTGYITLEKGTPLPSPGDLIVADEY